MHNSPRPAIDPRPLRFGSALLVLAAALHCGSFAHAAPGQPATAAAAATAQPAPSQRSASRTNWYAQAPDPVTGKLRESPVLGPADADGVMGGAIPSALPGWEPKLRDTQDAYVYVPAQGWLKGDTRAERQQ
jgi:hypothetical protein